MAIAVAPAEDGRLPLLLEGREVWAAAALGSAMPAALVQAAATAAAAAGSALAVLIREAAAATLERAEALAELAAAAAALADPLPLTDDLQAATLLAGVLMPKLPSAVAKEVAAVDALARADTQAQLDGALAGAAARGSALTTLLSPAQVAVPMLSRTVEVMLADLVPSLAVLEHVWKLIAAQAARLGKMRAQWRAPC